MLKIDILKDDFTVCKLKELPKRQTLQKFCFLSVTDSEISLVCPVCLVPENTESRVDNWKGFRICGTLDFSLIGILAHISGLLAKEKISVFAVSTYDTDYIFTKSESFSAAVKTLSGNGYTINNTEI